MTLTQANRMKDWNKRSQAAEENKSKAYTAAETKYQAALKAADTDFAAGKIDEAGKAQRLKDAEGARNAEQQGAEAAYSMESQRLKQEQDALAPPGGNGSGKNAGNAVTLPDGTTYTFPTAKAASDFKAAAGIQ